MRLMVAFSCRFNQLFEFRPRLGIEVQLGDFVGRQRDGLLGAGFFRGGQKLTTSVDNPVDYNLWARQRESCGIATQ